MYQAFSVIEGLIASRNLM